MSVEFRCTQCNRLLRTKEEAAGKKARCPECGTILDVPFSSAPEEVRGAPPAAFGARMPPPSAGRSPFGPGAAPRGAGLGSENPYQSPETQAGQAPYGAPGYSPGHVPNYLVQAILCTLFCCLPFGIVAIVYAAQVNGHMSAGNYAAAASTSRNARMWCWVSFWLGLLPALLWMVFFMMAAVAGAL